MPSKATSQPPGNRRSSRVLAVHGSGSLVADGGKEGLGVEDRQPLGLGDAQALPDVERVAAVAEALQARAQAACSASSAASERSGVRVEQATAPRRGRRSDRRPPAPPPRPAGSGACRRRCARPARGRASRTPRRPWWSRSPRARTGRAGPPRSSRRRRTGARRCPCRRSSRTGPPIEHDHRNAGGARPSSTARITSDTAIRPALASCRRTPPDSTSSRTAAGRSSSARSQQADQLGAVHLAHGAAHEAAFLRGDEDRPCRPACPGRR